jgi:HlyD family secretion protein
LFQDNINAQIELAKLENLSEIKEIEEEINLLTVRQNQTKQVISSFETLEQETKDEIQEQKSLTSLRIQMLEEQKNQIRSIYTQKLKQLEDRKDNELEIYDLQLERLKQEENLLSQEKTYLKNYAPINGVIGDVFAQSGELISPYETIVSIYEKHPRIIKAYMNEKNKYQLNVGDEVWVESSNREYSITGKVAEIGSRITSYPTRLLVDQQTKIWGQELFIEIPPDNLFLNGEKVYVRRK